MIWETSTHLNRLVIDTELRGMLEGREYRRLDLMPPFVTESTE